MSDYSSQFARGPRRPYRRTDEEIHADYAAGMARRQQDIRKYGAELSNEEFAFLNDFERDPERYRVELEPGDFDLIGQAFPGERDGADYAQNRYRVATAMRLSRMYRIPFREAYSQHDAIIEAQYGERVRRDPKTAFKAVADSFALGRNQMRLADLGASMLALPSGSEERNRLWREAEDIGRDNETLADGVTRHWFLEGVKGLGQSLPFTVRAAGAGFLGGFINPALGVVSAAAVSARDMAGLEYVSLLGQGVEDGTARRVAVASGAIQGAIEALLGDVAQLGARTGLAQAIFKKLHYAGKFGWAARTLLAAPFNMVEEGVEEALQEVVSITGENYAKGVTEGVARGRDPAEAAAEDLATAAYREYLDLIGRPGYGGEALPRTKGAEAGRRVWESFKGGFLTAIVMGVPVVLRDGAVSAREARELRAVAMMAEKPEEVAAFMDTQESFRDMGKEAKAEIAAELHGRHTQERLAEQETQEREYRRNRLYGGEDTTGGEAYRTEEGRLYAEHRRQTGSGGVVSGEFSIGNPNKAGDNRYGEVTYELSGNEIVIDRVRLAEGREGLEEELLQAFADDAGREIVWEEKTWKPGAKAAAAQVRIGFDYPRPRSAAEVREYRLMRPAEKRLYDRLAETMPRMTTDMERRAVVELFKAGADFHGLELGQYLDRHFQEQVIGNDDANAAATARNEPGRKKGAIAFDPGTGKALISGSSWADITTASHEFAHALRRQLGGEYLAEAERAFGVREGNWTREQEEAFSKAFEKYLTDGEAPTNGLRELFRKFKEFMGKIYRMARGRLSLTPEQKALFDRIFLRAEENRAAREGLEAGSAKMNPDPVQALYQDDARVLFQTEAESGEPSPLEIAEAARQMEEVRKQYEGTDRWMRAPNGEPTNLTERQWLQVRTPAFKAWFGDWEASVKPGSVSQVIAENGEPLVVWHQTGAEIEIFDPRRPGAGQFDNETPFGIFLKPDSRDIGLQGKRQMPLFAMIANPFLAADRAELGRYLAGNAEGYAELRKRYDGIDAEYRQKTDALEAEAYRRFEEEWEPDNQEATPGERGKKLDELFEAAGLQSAMEQWDEAGNEIAALMKEIIDGHFRESGHDGIILEKDDGGIGKRTTRTIIAFSPVQVKSAGGNAGTFMADSPSIYYQDDSLERIIDDEAAPFAERAGAAVRKAGEEYREELLHNDPARDTPSNDWPANFPRVAQMSTVAAMQAHPDYKAAKAGGMEAAARLVADILAGKNQQEKIRLLAETYPDAIVVPVHAEEAAGMNKIPSQFASYISEITGLQIADDIVMTNTVGRTGSGLWHRMAFRPRFAGTVQPGRKYIVVDDAVTGGGTFGEMRRFIELNGGEVVHFAAIGAAQFGTNLALSEKTRLDLEAAFDVKLLQDFLREAGLYGGNYKSLTESEARAILHAKGLDAARNRIAEARLEGIHRTRQESVRAPEGDAGPPEEVTTTDTDDRKISPDTLFHDYEGDAFTDPDLRAFVERAPDIVEMAVEAESPEALREDYENYNEAFGEQSQSDIEKAAEMGWYSAIHEYARRIKEDPAVETAAVTEERTVDDFLDFISKDEGIREIYDLKEAAEDRNYQPGNEEDAARQEIALRAAALLDNPLWNMRDKNGEINRDVMTKLRSMIRGNPVRYMEIYAQLRGDISWMPSETEASRLGRLDRGREEELAAANPEQMRRIEREIGYEVISEKIRDRTLKGNEPELDKWEEELEERRRTVEKKLDAQRENLSEWQKILAYNNELLEKEKLLAREMDRDTSAKGLTAIRRQQAKIRKLEGEIRSNRVRYGQYLKSLNRAERQYVPEAEKLIRELRETEQAIRAVGDLRNIRIREVRALVRKPDLKTVHINQARQIRYIQSFFGRMYADIPRFVGKKAKNLRELIAAFTTDDGYRSAFRNRWPTRFRQAEDILYIPTTGGQPRRVKSYTELTAPQRNRLYALLIEDENLLKKLGIDALEPPVKMTAREREITAQELRDVIPGDVLYKMENSIGLAEWTMEEIETLGGIMNDIRAQGREARRASQDARRKMYADTRKKIIALIGANTKRRLVSGSAEEKEAEARRAFWPNLAFSQMNGMRFFRHLGGGDIENYLSRFVMQGEDRAYNEENRRVMKRREEVEKLLEKEGIKPKELWTTTLALEAPGFAKTTFFLDELLYLRRASYNERAEAAVVFGNFMTAAERADMKQASIRPDDDPNWKPDPKKALELQERAVRRYEKALAALEEFLSKKENAKFRAVEKIIGDDYDANYNRLREYVALEFNEELGSEAFYIPLMRLESTGADLEAQSINEALNSAGFGMAADKGFTLSRIDIAPWHQTPVRLGLYRTWDQMVVKQEHLMAYGPYLREMRQVFEGRDSAALREAIKGRHSSAANDYIRKWISDLAAPGGAADFSALDQITRLVRGHYPAAVLGFRISSIIKQAITSPPPFLQHIGPLEYISGAADFIGNKKIRDLIQEKSVFMKTRMYDPAVEMVRQLEKMYLPGRRGKIESALAQVEKTGMHGLELIDYWTVAPGWYAAYKKKLAEFKNSEMDAVLIDAEAVRYADQIVRDTQPSSRTADLAPMFRGKRGAAAQVFLQFQVPMSVIFQNLVFDMPNAVRRGNILQALSISGVYAITAAVVGALGEDEEGEKLNPAYRLIDAGTGLLESIPVLGGGLAYSIESLARTGRVRQSTFRPYPILDSATKSLNAAFAGNWGRGALAAVEAFGYAAGLPVGALGEVIKVVEERNPLIVAGIK